MKRIICLGIVAGFLLSGGARAADGTTDFDGTWDTTLSCSNLPGVLGYSFEFPSVVKDGELLGGKGTKDEPGWLQLKGTVAADGSAKIYANGLVGASEAAVGHRPKGTAYGYHIKATFSGKEGSGTRVEGRPCDVSFVKTR